GFFGLTGAAIQRAHHPYSAHHPRDATLQSSHLCGLPAAVAASKPVPKRLHALLLFLGRARLAALALGGVGAGSPARLGTIVGVPAELELHRAAQQLKQVELLLLAI